MIKQTQRRIDSLEDRLEKMKEGGITGLDMHETEFMLQNIEWTQMELDSQRNKLENIENNYFF